ncbi:MAG: Asp23/Gls24 family envelope stress response protein [Clostridia bacterium]|nr:Asp23/Gls24 family envelope stress response protein [Clostridia bacterium]
MALNEAENSKGLVTYNKNILLSIINLAAKEISGVASLCSNFSGSSLKKLFSNNYYEGVKLTHTKDGLIIDVYINVYSNYNVADVAFRVQENIKSGIVSMVNINVHQINVRVMGVEFNNAEKK